MALRVVVERQDRERAVGIEDLERDILMGMFVVQRSDDRGIVVGPACDAQARTRGSRTRAEVAAVAGVCANCRARVRMPDTGSVASQCLSASGSPQSHASSGHASRPRTDTR